MLGLLGDLYSTNAKVAGPATSETMLLDCPECKEEMDRQNIVVLFNTSSPPYNILCADDRVETLEDVKGLKIRAVGSYGPLAAHLGATPVNITYGEIFEAMQRGQIDCVLGSLAWMENYSLKDVTNYVLEAPFGSTRGLGLMTVNKDVWEGLPADQRKALLDNMGGMISGAVHGYLEQDEEAKKNAMAKGVVFEQPSAAFSAALEPSPKFKQENLDKAASLGVKDPQKIADSFNAVLPKWQKIAEEVGMDKDAYAKALQREIYDKVDY